MSKTKKPKIEKQQFKMEGENFGGGDDEIIEEESKLEPE